MTVAEVRLWGRRIAAVSIEPGSPCAAFEYDPAFAGSGIQVAPIAMPLSREVFRFPELPEPTFRGLPGLLADSLPDRFGNALIDTWLATQGRRPEDFDAIERLCYIGSRGMGALEFRPTLGPEPSDGGALRVEALVELASEVLSDRERLEGTLADEGRTEALRDILRVGTSAGGARAKAVIAWNPATNEVRSGQVACAEGFEHWLLKFDGVRGNGDHDVEDPRGFGAVEYAYHLMAREAGIEMSECQLLEEGGRRHFMTRRFDRGPRGEKFHMQSLAALAHFDLNSPGAHGYEELFSLMRRLGIPMTGVEEQFRRMLFNVVARNQDDHVKNVAFLMDRRGVWRLAPAFDLTYAYNPRGAWTSRHQMSINGKRDDFELEDLRECARSARLKRGRMERMLEEVRAAVERWPEYAEQAGVREEWRGEIARHHRMEIR